MDAWTWCEFQVLINMSIHLKSSPLPPPPPSLLCVKPDNFALIFLSFFLYTKDHDKRVREATQLTFQQLVEQVKRNLAPHLRTLMGPWLLAQCDTYPAARMNARAAFNTAFPAHKQSEAIGYCSVQVMQVS